MTKLKLLLLPILFILAASYILNLLVPATHPYGGIRLPLTSREILERSRKLLQSQHMDSTPLSAEVRLQQNASLLRQAQSRFGIRNANTMLRDSLPGYYWHVRWTGAAPIELNSGSGSASEKEVRKLVESLRGEVTMRFDTRGRLLEFQRKVADSTFLPTIPDYEAKQLATEFFGESASGKMDSSQLTTEARIARPRRTDYRFAFMGRTPGLNTPVKYTMVVAGSTIASLEQEDQGVDPAKKGDGGPTVQILLVLLYAFIGIAMIVVTFRRMRTYEIGFRQGIIAGLFAATALAVQMVQTMRGDNAWEVLLPLTLGPLFVGLGMTLVWSVGESLVRETWKDKLHSFDLLSRGHALQPRVGLAVVRGIAAGTAGLALLEVLVFAAVSVPWMGTAGLMHVSGDEGTINVFGVSLPWLYIISHSLYAAAFPFAFFVLFVVSLLRRWITRPVLLIGAASLTIGLLTVGSSTPFLAWWLLQSAVAAVGVWTFYRYDGMTAYIAIATYLAVPEAAALMHAGNPAYAATGLLLLAAGIVIVSGGAILAVRKEQEIDPESIAPAYARFITERQRLQQELEIARTVQMSFLPKSNPTSFKLDIASRCEPALEVGGDYYDFVEISATRLGIAVGDVSGKGTQAAFFMTLTKGFLRAIAQSDASPSATLTQVNRLFYDNVQRGVFISMVYAVFDIVRREVTIARAGHNPVIMRKSQSTGVEVVSPTGLALGLDPGETFSRSIQEVSIPFQPDDLFVFYTDGFPEAMNKNMEEFGEERLCATVQNLSGGTAQEIMDGVFKEMKQFVGRARQHDDMTIVVVKVS